MTSDRPTASWGRFHQFRLIIRNTIFTWLNILFESDGVAIWRISHGTNCGLATGTQVRLLDNGLKLLNVDVLVEGLVGSLLGWGLGDLFVTGTSRQVARPTVRGSRNLTNGHQVLQLDNGLELFNLLSLYPAEGFCGPLCFDFSGSDFWSTFSHSITIWWISLDLTGITTLIPWKWIFDLVRQTYTCV